MRVVGYLEPMAVITGFAVTPVVGFVAAEYSLELDEFEVAEAFEVPLGIPARRTPTWYIERTAISGASICGSTSITYEGRRIWGHGDMLKRFNRY